MPNQKGNITLIILGIVAIAIVAGGVGYFVAKKPSQKEEQKQEKQIIQQQAQQEQQKSISEMTEQKTQQSEVKDEMTNNVVPENQIPKITFSLKNKGNCNLPAKNPVFNILSNNVIIGEVEGANCESGESIVLAQNQKNVYFSMPPGGLGGYILFPIYSNLYRINLNNNQISKIISTGFRDYDFSSDLSKVVYNGFFSVNEQGLILFDLSADKEIKTYRYPEGYTQFGSFKFSPDESSVAFVAADGPVNEKSAVYVISLNNGNLKLILEKSNHIFKIEGWSNNDTVVYK